MNAGRNVTLAAADQLNLHAAHNTASLRSDNQSSSGSIGVGYNTSSGFSATASASKGKGNADGQDLSHLTTKLGAGDTAHLIAGGDASLKGAVVQAPRIVAEVGGDLNIESLQDSSTYNSKQNSAGFSLSVPLGGGLPGGSLSASKSTIDSTYASVNEQTGLQAGDGGFDIQVKGDTALIGGAITSTQNAIDQNRNRFQTGGTLTLTDLQNQAEYQGKAAGLAVGTGFDPQGKLVPQGTSAGLGEKTGSAQSTTQAAISGIAGNTQARTGDKETGIAPIFDAQKVQKEIDAQVKITQSFFQQAPKAAADYAKAQAAELKKQGKEEEARKWEEGGAYRIALHTAIGALGGGTGGALGAGASAAAAPLLNEMQDAVAAKLKEAGAGEHAAKLAGQLISGATAAGVGALAGGTSGAVAGFAIDANNRQLHPTEQRRAKELAAKSKGRYTEAQIADALRWANNSETGETVVSNTMVNANLDAQLGGNPADPAASRVYDPMVPGQTTTASQPYGISQGENGTVLVQNMGQVAKPSEDLMAFIQQNTGTTYTWDTAAWQAVPQTAFTQNGARYGLFSANGKTYRLPLADCPASGCQTFSSIAWASTNPQDQAALQAYATAAGVEMTSFVSRTAGIVGSAATAAAATPGPHQPVAAGVAIAATGVGLAADAVEQAIKPDVGKTAQDFLIKLFIEKGMVERYAPTAAPAVNEMTELWKQSKSSKSAQEWINEQWDNAVRRYNRNTQ